MQIETLGRSSCNRFVGTSPIVMLSALFRRLNDARFWDRQARDILLGRIRDPPDIGTRRQMRRIRSVLRADAACLLDRLGRIHYGRYREYRRCG